MPITSPELIELRPFIILILAPVFHWFTIVALDAAAEVTYSFKIPLSR